MDFKEDTLKEQYLYKGKILSLKKDKVMLLDGQTSEREIVEHKGGSAVLCVKSGKVLLVKQFRYAYKKPLWEIPAGKLNEGEDPKDTAVRELEEECGIKALSIEKMFEIYPSPGYTNEIIRLYKVGDFIPSRQHLDKDEFLEYKWFEIAELKQKIKNGDIKDAKTLIALLSII